LVEQRIENPRVGGSIPPQATKLQDEAHCMRSGLFLRNTAGIAQLVERNLAKVEVESSRLFSRSNFQDAVHIFAGGGHGS
jgi:hypothetical protein